MSIKIVLRQLFEAYPNNKATEGTVAVYHRMLQDLPAEELQAVIDQCIAECRFLPTVAEIIDRHRMLTRDLGQPTPEEEWEKVMREIRRIGSWGAPVFDNEVTKRVVEAMGWLALCQSDKPGIDRRQFIDIYNGLTERGEQVAKLTPAARQLAMNRLGQLPADPSLPLPPVTPYEWRLISLADLESDDGTDNE